MSSSVAENSIDRANELFGGTNAPVWYHGPSREFEWEQAGTAFRPFERYYETPVGDVHLFRCDEAAGDKLTVGDSTVYVEASDEHLSAADALEFGTAVVMAATRLAASDGGVSVDNVHLLIDQLQDVVREIRDQAATCDAEYRDDEPFLCLLPEGHDGEHHAQGVDPRVTRTWAEITFEQVDE